MSNCLVSILLLALTCLHVEDSYWAWMNGVPNLCIPKAVTEQSTTRPDALCAPMPTKMYIQLLEALKGGAEEAPAPPPRRPSHSDDKNI